MKKALSRPVTDAVSETTVDLTTCSILEEFHSVRQHWFSSLIVKMIWSH